MDTVAQSGLEYVEIVARLATDQEVHAKVKKKIQAGLAHSDLVDMAGYTRNLEAAYIEALTHSERGKGCTG
jgi:predicted O-linked N-acetylglucosamine transferase (SPINDLY family)